MRLYSYRPIKYRGRPAQPLTISEPQLRPIASNLVDGPLQPLNHAEWLFTASHPPRKGLNTHSLIMSVFFRRLDAAFDAPFLRELASATCSLSLSEWEVTGVCDAKPGGALTAIEGGPPHGAGGPGRRHGRPRTRPSVSGDITELKTAYQRQIRAQLSEI